MKKLYFLVLMLLASTLFTAHAQTQKYSFTKTCKNLNVKDIVINQETYKTIQQTGHQFYKNAKIYDKTHGIIRVKDDPHARENFERRMLINPLTKTIPQNIREKELSWATSAQSRLQSRLKSASYSWEQKGPYNVGGRTRALAADIKNQSIILAGGVTGGLWRTTDNGANWTRVTEMDVHPSVTAIAQDPRDGQTNTWYYTTGERKGSAGGGGAFYKGNGVFKSSDNGQTWVNLSATTSEISKFDSNFDFCWNITVDPTNGDVYVAAHGGIFRSQDGGESWNEVLTSSKSSVTDIICTETGVKYATMNSIGDKGGIYRSTSGNLEEWIAITPSQFPADYERIVLDYAPSNSKVVYFLAETPNSGFQGHSLWKLTYDNATGANWKDRSSNIPARKEGDRDVSGYKSQGSYNMVIKVAPDDENMVFIGGTNLHRSDDGFSSTDKTYWVGGYSPKNNVSQYINHHPDVHALFFKPNSSELLCGHDGGVSLTTNFKTLPASASDDTPVDWEDLNHGYQTTQSYTLAINQDKTNSLEIMSGFQDNGTWYAKNPSSTSEWEEANSGDGAYCAISDYNGYYLSSSQNGRVSVEYSDGGWARLDPEGASGVLFINPFILDENNSNILFYSGGNYVWRNSDFTEISKGDYAPATINWEKMEISKASGTVTYMESSVSPANILYYGTSNGKVYRIDKSNSTFAKQTEITGNEMPDGYISSIDSDPSDANKVIVSFSNYEVNSVFYSENAGQSWVNISGNLEENGDPTGNGPSVRTVAIQKLGDKTIYYSGTSTGLYKTENLDDNNTQWEQIGNNVIGNTVVSMVKVRRDGTVVAATHGNGVFAFKTDMESSIPIANFTTSNDTIQIGESVQFLDRSIGKITNWEWTINGVSNTNYTTEHPGNITFPNPGTFSISLKVNNENGENTKIIEKCVTVKSIQADFIADATIANINEGVNFTDKSTGNVTSWKWSFPGATTETSQEQNPSNITYTQAGKYTVSLEISDKDFSDKKVKTEYIQVIDPDDNSDETLSNIEDENNLTVYNLTGTNSGPITGHNNLKMAAFAEKFTIKNPNLNAVKSIQISPSEMQSQSSNPNIRITIWDAGDKPGDVLYFEDIPFSKMQKGVFNEIVFESPVALKNNSFYAGFQIFYENPVDSFAVHNEIFSSDLENTAFLKMDGQWSGFADIFGADCNTSLAIKAVACKKYISADFTADVVFLNEGDQVNFSNKSSESATSWNWSFPGANQESSSEQNPSGIIYSQTGKYDVTLEVSDGTYTDKIIKKEFITIQDPNNFEDDLLYNVDNEGDLTVYSFNDNKGFATGHNAYEIQYYAEKFKITNNNLNAVKSVHLFPAEIVIKSSDPKISIIIWEGQNKPEKEIFKQEVKLIDLKNRQYNEIILDHPVMLSGKTFFAGFQVYYTTPADSLAIANQKFNSERQNTAYIMNEGTWHTFPELMGDEAITSLAIKAGVGYTKVLAVEGNLNKPQIKKLEIFPNPMQQQATVRFPNENNNTYRLVVVDASGRVVRIIENITNNNITINREQLKSGIHIINLEGEKIYRGKLLVK